jgi:DNA replication and repair protein RecF
MLEHLVVRDFRNLAAIDLDVDAAGLAIVGDNGHGKTNLLEAVAYLRLLRSWRGARDADVVRFGATAFHVRAQLGAPARVHTVGVGYERASKRKRATLDGVEQSRLADALGALPSVCFSPADVVLVSGGPGERRRFLDVALALTSPQYLSALQSYRSALLRRNATLRELQRASRHTGGADQHVAVWEPALSEHGATLVIARRAWASANAVPYAELCHAIGESKPSELRYQGAVNDADDSDVEAALAAQYEAQRSHELRRGATLVGPHRDELQLLLGGRELRTFGSAGQHRTAAIALRLRESATVQAMLGAPPLMLLDDPFAELDTRRSQAILSLLAVTGVGQVLLAVPRAEDIPSAFTALPRRSMEQGVLS